MSYWSLQNEGTGRTRRRPGAIPSRAGQVARQAPARALGGAAGDRPVLDPPGRAEQQRVRVACHVARRHYVIARGRQCRLCLPVPTSRLPVLTGWSASTRSRPSQATPLVRSRPFPPSHSVFGTEPTDSMTRSASSVVPSVSVTARTRAPPPKAPPSKATGAVPKPEPHAVGLVPAQQFGGQLVAEAAHRQRLRLDDGDVKAPGAGRRGDLAADEAATHDHDAAGPLQVGRSAVRSSSVRMACRPAQRPWQVQVAGPDTGGDHQAVPAEHRAVAERHVPRGEVRRDGRRGRAASRCSSRRPALPGTGAGPRRTRC